MKYSDAIKKAILEQLESSQSLYLFGQDIVGWGGYGEILKELSDKFPDNFFDTPIAEAATTGIATGMAMTGRPTFVEYAFFDFVLHATDQIINNTSKIQFFSNNKISLPITLYVTLNSGRKYGATHSQSLEYIFANVPGLEVLFPTNVTDAYQMLKATLSSQTPSLFVTHKHLLDNEFKPNEIGHGKARVLSTGKDLTIFSYGRAVEMTRKILKEEQINNVELIDLRYLTTIDYDTLIESVLKTNRVLAIEEGYGAITNQVLGKIATLINVSEIGFYSLNSEFECIGISNEEEVLINKSKIKEKIKSIVH